MPASSPSRTSTTPGAPTTTTIGTPTATPSGITTTTKHRKQPIYYRVAALHEECEHAASAHLRQDAELLRRGERLHARNLRGTASQQRPLASGQVGRCRACQLGHMPTSWIALLARCSRATRATPVCACIFIFCFWLRSRVLHPGALHAALKRPFVPNKCVVRASLNRPSGNNEGAQLEILAKNED